VGIVFIRSFPPRLLKEGRKEGRKEVRKKKQRLN
jgi:hypothetical protein